MTCTTHYPLAAIMPQALQHAYGQLCLGETVCMNCRTLAPEPCRDLTAVPVQSDACNGRWRYKVTYLLAATTLFTRLLQTRGNSNDSVN